MQFQCIAGAFSFPYTNEKAENVDDGGSLGSSWERTNEWSGMRNITDTRYAWLLKAFEHQTHHRGQTTIYIRLVGVKPPTERLF